MEGSRHEKAALVSVAYIIGMVTAFIWFGLPVSTSTSSESVITTGIQSASLISSVSKPAPEPEPVQVPTKNSVSYNNGVLEFTSFTGTQVLSFNPVASGFEDTTEFALQGTHFGELVYSVSDSEEYVFFCEKKAEDATTCSPFVYDALTNTIYPVKQDGTAIDILVTAAAEAKFDGSSLQVGGVASQNVQTPWELGY